MSALQVVDGRQVHGGIFANGGVRAATGFHAEDAVGWQCVVFEQEVSVFSCVDVVGDHGDVVVVFQGFAQLAQQGGFAGAYRATYSNSQTMFHGVFSLSLVISVCSSASEKPRILGFV